jgi:hypothetical protein
MTVQQMLDNAYKALAQQKFGVSNGYVVAALSSQKN